MPTLVIPPRLSVVNHAPNQGLQATATAAAGSGGQRHVAWGIVATTTAGTTAPAAGVIYVNLRDGASGAGTILLQLVIGIEAVAGKPPTPLVLTGLHIPGSANTAMTLEFANGHANSWQTVNLLYYTIH